jgi:hypothetical protein
VTDDVFLEQQREAQRTRRAVAKAAGLCSACCARDPAPGYKSCAICLERRRICELPHGDERRARLAALRAGAPSATP